MARRETPDRRRNDEQREAQGREAEDGDRFAHGAGEDLMVTLSPPNSPQSVSSVTPTLSRGRRSAAHPPSLL